MYPRCSAVLAAWALVVWCATASPALAYIGPGAGITMLGALWGVIVAVLLAVAAVLFWPIRALLRRRRRSNVIAGDATSTVEGGTSS